MIVAFVRCCRSEATTRPGKDAHFTPAGLVLGFGGGARQRIMCPGRDRICASAGWCFNRRFPVGGRVVDT